MPVWTEMFAGISNFASSYFAKEDPGADRHAQIRAYYEQCDWHYRVVSGNSDNLALHYGYWDHTTRSHAEAVVRMNAILADAVGIRRGDRVLDAGCGNGGSSLWLARERGAHCHGLTLVPNQAERGNRHAARRGLQDQVRLSVGDYERTGFAPGAFDVVWAQESLCYAIDRCRTLTEWARVLTDGGRLLVSDGILTVRDAPPHHERVVRTWLDGFAILDLPTEEELRRDLEVAGFADVRVLDVSERVRPDAERLGRIAEVVAALPKAVEVISRAGARERGNVHGAVAQREALRLGAWKHVCVTARKAPAPR